MKRQSRVRLKLSLSLFVLVRIQSSALPFSEANLIRPASKALALALLADARQDHGNEIGAAQLPPLASQALPLIYLWL